MTRRPVTAVTGRAADRCAQCCESRLWHLFAMLFQMNWRYWHTFVEPEPEEDERGDH